MSDLPNRIRELRTEKKISGTKIAKELSISPQYFYDIEKGERNLSAELASQIADILEVTVDYLLGKTENEREDFELESYNRKGIDLKNKVLSKLKLLVDDEGYFFEDLREDVFNYLDSDLFFYFQREVNFHQFSYEHFKEFFNNPMDHSEFEANEIIEEFNSVFNYRSFKTILNYVNNSGLEAIYSSIDIIINKHGISDGTSRITDHHPIYSTEKDFIRKLDLTDANLLKQFDLRIDGRSLNQEEAKMIIAYIRSFREITE